MTNLKSDEKNEFLQTEHLTSSLRSRSVRSGAAVLGMQAAQLALNLVATAVLARLLAPADFGLVAMSATVGSFLMLFLDLGLGSVTVQRADLTRAQLNTLFGVNVALGLSLAILMAMAAPVVSRFFGQRELTAVTMAWAFGFVFAGLTVQHSALLRRQMRFASLASIEVVSLGLGIAVAVAAAALGAGYWALVYRQLVQQGAAFVGAWLACGWRPGIPARSEGVRPLLSFGAGLTGFGLLTYLAGNLDNIIIGRAAGTAALGLYQRAYSLLLLPVDRIRGPVSTVVIPALSHLQGDRLRFKSYYLKAITLVAAVGMPVVVFLFVFAEDAVLLILGPQWQQSIILFQVLAPAAFVETFNTVGSWACMPFGKSARLIRWQIFATTVMVVSFLVGVRWGALGVAIACSLTTVLLRVPGIPYLLKGSPVSPSDVVGALARPAGAAIAAGTIVLALRMGIFSQPGGPLVLLAAALVFGAVYLGLWLVLPGGRQMMGPLRALFNDLVSHRIEPGTGGPGS